MAFFDSLRLALHSCPPGVHQAGPPATPAQLRAAATRIGRDLPPDHADLLLSWNGVSLFQDLIVLFATEDARLASPAPGHLRIGEVEDGVLWLDAAGKLRLLDESAPDPILCGSALAPWLSAVLAREALVFDREGEFRDVFSEDGLLKDTVRRKRVAAGRKCDPGAALYLLEEAELLVEGQKREQALRALAQAVQLDPAAGPALEMLAAIQAEAGQEAEAEQAFVAAAAATSDPWLRASRLLSAALSAPPERSPLHAAAARAADPGHAAALLEEAHKRLQQGDRDEAAGLYQRLQLLCPTEEDARARLAGLARDLRVRSALQVL